MAKTGPWAEIQRERARQQRLRDQEFRAFRQAEERAQHERVKAQKAAARKAAADLTEAKRLYREDRKAEAEEMSRTLQDQVTELDGVLTAGIRTGPLITFRSLKRQETYPPFDAGPLVGLTKNAALEYAAQGVRVNAVGPASSSRRSLTRTSTRRPRRSSRASTP